MIKFLNLHDVNKQYEVEIKEAINRVIDSGQYILSTETQNFENEFSKYCNAKYCAGVGNGLDALVLALEAHDVGYGDEVIVPSNTFIATWLAVRQVGAKIVAVEPDYNSSNIDAAKIAKYITKNTKIIMPVHLYGRPANLDEIRKIANDHNISIIEDAAQAHGAMYKNKKIGGHGNTVAWSFYPGKNLGAMGDAGAVTTNDEKIINRIKKIRNYGSEYKYIHEYLGRNTRLDEIQAAILRIKLRGLDADNEKRKNIVIQYNKYLSDLPIVLPKCDDKDGCVWHLYVIKTKKRNELMEFLKNQGIDTLIHYPSSPHLQESFSYLKLKQGTFPITELLESEILSLPLSPSQSIQDTNFVIDNIKLFYQNER